MVGDVLTSWEYPRRRGGQLGRAAPGHRNQRVAPRSQNGKAVKAVYHSAFAVALMIYCRTNRLPHPGFLVLDSPLVTYGKPIHYQRMVRVSG